VAKESLSDGTLSADSNQGPPPVRPRVLRASAEERWGLARFEGRQLPHQMHGIIAPSAVDLASQDDKGSLLRVGNVRVLAAFGEDRLAKDSPVRISRSRSGFPGASVHTHYGDVREQRDTALGAH
jgi:hypothetical protein